MLHRPSSSPSSYFSLRRIAAAMFTRPPFRGRRSFSDNRVVSGDSHFQSVRDANFSLQNGRTITTYNNDNGSGNKNSSDDYRRVYFSYDNLNQYKNFSSRCNNYNNSDSASNSNSKSNGGFPFQPQLQSYRPRTPFQARPNQHAARPRPPDYRNWEFAKHPPPPHSERFIVLSYNMLADYLANNHRTLYWHIPRRFMSWDWRKRNILFELGLWSADVMCFQEVDRFPELEEELKRHGYSGIWKMRTGEPIDGCAILWRTSRFKLVYEECIEFNKLGMRDNVAQVCVLELLVQSQTDKKAAVSEISEVPNRVVVCNIHVLYNPRRGEIKLGQVRVLLERAQAISKKWDDAPLVLCGDFNCIPKSPLYNFISEQKLDISGIDRDKVSGQATAEIRPPSRQFGRQTWGQSTHNMANLATNQNNSTDGKKNDSLEKHEASKNLSTTNCRSQLPSDECFSSVPDKSCDGSFESKYDNPSTKSADQLARKINQDPKFTSVNDTDKDVIHVSLSKEHVQKCHLTSDGRFPSSTDNFNKDIEEEESRDSYIPCSETLKVDTSDMPTHIGDAKAHSLPTSVDEPGETNSSSAFYNLDEKLAGISLVETDETLEANENLGDEAEKMCNLNDEGDVFSSNLGESVLEDLYSTSESAAVDVYRPVYDPSQWTPMEIATAAGNSNNTVLGHSLKLSSTYTEVEDRSGTRDSIGEPQVTSYNSCFMGTVDYIWRSEGLCTVKVLAPIPKTTMQPSGGYPTKKWGSDHIALAAELAFTNNHLHVEAEKP